MLGKQVRESRDSRARPRRYGHLRRVVFDDPLERRDVEERDAVGERIESAGLVAPPTGSTRGPARTASCTAPTLSTTTLIREPA